MKYKFTAKEIKEKLPHFFNMVVFIEKKEYKKLSKKDIEEMASRGVIFNIEG